MGIFDNWEPGMSGMENKDPYGQTVTPPLPDEEYNQRKQGWAGFLENVRNSPVMQQLLIQTGARLMQPIQPGQTTIGHIGGAIGAGLADSLAMQAAQQKALAQAQKDQAEIAYKQAQTKDLEQGGYSTEPRFTSSGKAYTMNKRGEVKWLDESGITPRDKLEAVNGVWANPYNGQPVGVAPQDLNKPFYYGPSGTAEANAPFQQYEINKAKAGKTSVNTTNNIAVSTEKKFMESIAGALGPEIVATNKNAKSAVATIDTLNRIRTAIDTGKVIAGPGTKPAMVLTQLGVAMGLSGKTSEETVVNTRKVIQGLAQLELEGAKQLQGQGQISEGEREIVRRAAAGKVDELTVPEIRALTEVLDLTARAKIRENASNVKGLAGNENAAPVVQYLNVPEPPKYESASGRQQKVKSLLDKYGTKK